MSSETKSGLNAWSSHSLLRFLFSNGSDSAEYKFGPPQPGKRMLLNPEEWSRVRMS